MLCRDNVAAVQIELSGVETEGKDSKYVCICKCNIKVAAA